MARRRGTRVMGEEIEFDAMFARDILLRPIDDQNWIVSGLIPSDGITVISGAPKSYKSWFALHIALCISQGNPVFGSFEASKSGVMIIDEENNIRIISQRLKKLGAPSDSDVLYLTQNDFDVENSDHLKKVEQLCKGLDIKVIVLDSLIRIHKAEENSAGEMAQVFSGIKSLTRDGKAVIVLHHERKENGYKSSAQMRMRGSSDISAAVDSHISVRKDPADETKIFVEQAQLRCDRPVEPFEVRLVENEDRIAFEFIGDTKVTKKETVLEKAITAVRLLLEQHPEGLLHKDIVETLNKSQGLGMKNVREGIRELKESRLLQEEPGDRGNEKLLRLATPE